MTTLEPAAFDTDALQAALNAGQKVFGGDLRPYDSWEAHLAAIIAAAIRAYLAARSAPEAGKAMDDADLKRIYRVLAEEGGGTWATYVMIDIDEAIKARLASVPAPSGAAGPIMWQVLLRKGWTDAGGRENAESWAKEGKQIRALYAAPQAVPAEEIAGLVGRLNAKHADWQKQCDGWIEKSKADGLDIEGDINAIRSTVYGEAAAALTSLSARLTEVEQYRDSLEYTVGDLNTDLTASEAEATSLRRKLEEAREALRVIATGSGYEWSETREQLHRIIDAAVGCANNTLRTLSGTSE